jgi:hypothetical protein
MSIISTVANYGGRVQDSQQGIKQFYVGLKGLTWIYEKYINNSTVITPSDKTKSVLINNDLIVTGSIYNTSDARLKENIVSIDSKNNSNNDDDNDLFTLNPVIFSYKNDINKKKHYGFLAQDIEKVFPELVENNYAEYKTVNYQELIPLMISKMKTMQKQIDELKEIKK